MTDLDPKAYIAMLVKGTTNSIIKAMNMSDRVMAKDGINDMGLKSGLDCCKQQLDMALDNPNKSVDVVQNNTIQEVVNQSGDFKSWLSGASSYLGVVSNDCFETESDIKLNIYGRMNADSLNNVR